MVNLFQETLSDALSEQELKIAGIGKEKLSCEKLGALLKIVSYRFENMLPTTTYTNLSQNDFVKAISKDADSEVIAYAIANRLWQMEVCAE